MSRFARGTFTAIVISLLQANACQGSPTDEIQVYDATIADTGTFDLTWHNNYTPNGGRQAAFSGGIAANHTLNGVAEWAYGVTQWFEAGIYFPLYSFSSNGSLTYNGCKLRTLFVVPHAAERSFFYGVNFEFSDNTRHWDPKPFTSEIRPIIGWRFGPVDLIVNPILDYGSTGVRGLDFAPATRLAAHVGAKWIIAAEEYDDFGPLRAWQPRGSQVHQLFAVVDRSFGRFSLEFGAGYGLTPASDRAVVKLLLSEAIECCGSR